MLSNLQLNQKDKIHAKCVLHNVYNKYIMTYTRLYISLFLIIVISSFFINVEAFYDNNEIEQDIRKMKKNINNLQEDLEILRSESQRMNLRSVQTETTANHNKAKMQEVNQKFRIGK